MEYQLSLLSLRDTELFSYLAIYRRFIKMNYTKLFTYSVHANLFSLKGVSFYNHIQYCIKSIYLPTYTRS